MCFFIRVTSVEYKFNLGEIRKIKLVEKMNDLGIMSSLLSVSNIDDMEFFLDIKKFLLERSIPKLEFSNKYFDVTNSIIWGTSIFWIYDGMMCVKDIDRFSNLSLVEAKKLLHDIERKGDDPIIFIRDKVLGKHISGNHRWHVKEKYYRSNKDKFEKNPYWYLTSTQLYIGLRPDQAR